MIVRVIIKTFLGEIRKDFIEKDVTVENEDLWKRSYLKTQVVKRRKRDIETIGIRINWKLNWKFSWEKIRDFYLKYLKEKDKVREIDWEIPPWNGENLTKIIKRAF